MESLQDVEDIVQNGYMGILEIISNLQNLATALFSEKDEMDTISYDFSELSNAKAQVLAYQIISRLILQEPISPWSIAPLAVHPILLALFAICRPSAEPYQQYQNTKKNVKNKLNKQHMKA